MKSKKEKKREKRKEKGLEKQEQVEEQQQLEFDAQGQEHVDVSFCISEINESNYHSLKTILEKFAHVTGITSAQWASLVVESKGHGNVAVADESDGESESQEEEQNNEQEENEEEDDEEDVCSGVLALISKESKQVKSVVNKMEISGQKQSISVKDIIGKNPFCLLLNERAINLPSFVIHSMHEVLIKDMTSLKQEDPSTFRKLCGGYVLVLSLVEKTEQNNPDHFIFTKYQDRHMLKHCQAWWLGETIGGAVRKSSLQKLHYIIKWKNYIKSVEQLGKCQE